MKLHIYVGYDETNFIAYQVLINSIYKNCHDLNEIHITPLRLSVLRKLGLYWRESIIGKDGQKYDWDNKDHYTSDFTYSRFLTPVLHCRYEREGPALYMDPDMLVRCDILEILESMNSNKYEIMCCQSNHQPVDSTKLSGLIQDKYQFKNWSSLMLFTDPKGWKKFHASGHQETEFLTEEHINIFHRKFLHGFHWLERRYLGQLDESWNWLDGFSNFDIGARIAHFTRGTPDIVDYPDSKYSPEWKAIASELGINI